MTTAQLIDRLRQRHADDQFPPPALPQEIARAEELIGFPLPPFMKSLYTEVSNGMFGPLVLPLFGPKPEIPFMERQHENAVLRRQKWVETRFGSEAQER